MFSNTSLKAKLLLAFTLIASFVVLVAWAGYMGMNAVYEDFSFIDKTVVQNFKRIQKIYNYSHESNRYLMRAYMARDEKNLKRLLKSANDNFAKFEEVRKDYMEAEFSPGEKEMVDKFFIFL